jgi:hypothetical protein
VTDRASLLGGKVERLCGVNCHCEPRFHGCALYSGIYVLTGAESHAGMPHAWGPTTCIRRIGIRSASGVSARSSDGVRGGRLDPFRGWITRLSNDGDVLVAGSFKASQVSASSSRSVSGASQPGGDSGRGVETSSFCRQIASTSRHCGAPNAPASAVPKTWCL